MFSLIDILSAMKINQLQLYMQNTFSFAGHETVWRNNTAYDARCEVVTVICHFVVGDAVAFWSAHAVDSGSNVRVEPCQVIVLCSLARYFESHSAPLYSGG